MAIKKRQATVVVRSIKITSNLLDAFREYQSNPALSEMDLYTFLSEASEQSHRFLSMQKIKVVQSSPESVIVEND